MIVAPYSRVRLAAIADLPAAVGPQITRTLLPAKPSVQLVPSDLHDRGPPVHVVRGQLRVAERREQGAHLRNRKGVPGFDRCLACDRGSKVLVPGRGAGHSITCQRVESLSQALLGIESAMRHRDRVDDQRASAESLDLEAELFEILAVGVERVGFCRAEVKSQWKKKPLRGRSASLQGSHELLVQNSLVGRMLIDEDKSVGVLERDVSPAELE